MIEIEQCLLSRHAKQSIMKKEIEFKSLRWLRKQIEKLTQPLVWPPTTLAPDLRHHWEVCQPCTAKVIPGPRLTSWLCGTLVSAVFRLCNGMTEECSAKGFISLYPLASSYSQWKISQLAPICTHCSMFFE